MRLHGSRQAFSSAFRNVASFLPQVKFLVTLIFLLILVHAGEGATI